MSKLRIWGRELEIKEIYDCYDDEEVLTIQEEALDRFKKRLKGNNNGDNDANDEVNSDVDNEVDNEDGNSISNSIDNCISIADDALEEVKKYCLAKDGDVIEGKKIDNIFKYVVPEKIFVKRDGRVALMCRYKFDMEQGIAVVFEEGKKVEVGSQDIIL